MATNNVHYVVQSKISGKYVKTTWRRRAHEFTADRCSAKKYISVRGVKVSLRALSNATTTSMQIIKVMNTAKGTYTRKLTNNEVVAGKELPRSITSGKAEKKPRTRATSSSSTHKTSKPAATKVQKVSTSVSSAKAQGKRKTIKPGKRLL